MKRKTPVRHTVKRHKRGGRWIESFERGHGKIQQKRPRKVVYKKQRVYSLIGIERDSRYAPHVGREHKTAITDVIKYLTAKVRVIGQVSNDEYTVKITESIDKSMGRSGRVLVILNSRPDEPVPVGYWMDSPEEEWGYSKTEYFMLPETERATLEAQEQLDKWVDKQFYSNWLDFYAPEIHDRMLWSGEIDIGVSFEERNEQAKKIVELIW